LDRVADEAHDPALAARAWVLLMKQLMGGKRPDDALALLPTVEAAIARAGFDPLLRARLAGILSETFRQKPDADEARRQIELSVKLYEEHDPRSLDLAAALQILGEDLAESGALAEAAAVLRRSLEIDAAAYGPDHVICGSTRASLGAVYVDQRRFP